MSATFPIELPSQPISLTELPANTRDEARETLERGGNYFFDGRPVATIDDATPDATAEWVKALGRAVLTPPKSEN